MSSFGFLVLWNFYENFNFDIKLLGKKSQFFFWFFDVSIRKQFFESQKAAVSECFSGLRGGWWEFVNNGAQAFSKDSALFEPQADAELNRSLPTFFHFV